MGSYEQLFFLFLFVFWCKKEKGNEGRGGGVWNVTWGYVGSMKGLILTSINSSIPTTGTRSNASRRAILISAIERPSVLLPRMWDHVLLSLLSPPPQLSFLMFMDWVMVLFCFVSQWAHFPHIHFGLMSDPPVKKPNVRQQVHLPATHFSLNYLMNYNWSKPSELYWKQLHHHQA